jgi:uncharacterized membrane protein YeaQ/YmgE (transglycosylase-associated protein family)
MIGMGFRAFLTLFVISFIVAAIMHNAIRYRFLGGVDGFLSKWIVGWVGAWIASPVLGHWFSGVALGGQYIIPAFLGAFALTFLGTAACKAVVKIRAGAEATEKSVAPATGTGQVAHEGRAA